MFLIYGGGNIVGMAFVSLSWLAFGAENAARNALWFLAGGALGNLTAAWFARKEER